ncbi:Conserved oligomeric Golgi complex subunit 6 [Holothuria leucospilota]|uniref:Conserved oligomeric Golgi complex subunit 6 n=1 Tax=Holothuria leucospilota TaxID=206669 RepID=A0A9Q1BP41_HOLLE|nr:Conserved oligomeric Golgi complex subunit 6 [Holothuria leucospilota]
MTEKEISVQGSSEGSTTSNPLSRKLNKILETRLENDKETLEALKALSTFFHENSLRTRRNLRGDIERRSLSISEEFADVFSIVKNAARDQTADLINKTTDLQKESQKLDMRAKVADAFLAKYQLKTEEVRVLRGTREGHLHEDFFQALNRVKQIHNDCKVLLRTNQQTAGLEIMESMALHQETAYERLYRWTQGECRSLTSDTVDVTSIHCRAMEALQDRPVLFRYVLDEFGTARRTAVVRGFIDALTRGGPGGTPRPIELHSHDPLRYVGDMLAWLHQASASEKEHLISLLRMATAQRPVSESGPLDICNKYPSLQQDLRELVRVEQVIVAEPGPMVLYKLANLLKFYKYTIGQLLNKEAALTSTLSEMEEFAQKVFFNALNVLASKLVEKVELPPADLGPTATLSQTLSLLQEILASHDSSVVSMDLREQDFARILTSVLDPLMQMCSLSASRLNPADMATYMINCLHAMQTTLSLYEYTDQRLEMLQAQTDAHVDTLVNEQASFILSRTALLQIYSIALQHKPEEGPLASLTGLNTSAIKDGMTHFDGFLATPDNYTLPQCNFLQSTAIREKIHQRAMNLIQGAYELLYKAIHNPDNQYQEPNSIMVRTPEQVKTLLS